MKKNYLIVIDIFLIIIFIIIMLLMHFKYTSIKINEVNEEIISAPHHIVCKSNELKRIYKIETDKNYEITKIEVTNLDNEPIEIPKSEENPNIEVNQEGVETFPDEPSKYFEYFKDETLKDSYECEDNI